MNNVYRYEDLPRQVAEFQSQGVAGKINAAGVCAMFMAGAIECLQAALKFQQGDTCPDDARSLIVASYPRFCALKPMLAESLAGDAWVELTRMHEHPVRVGDLVAGSYIEAVQQWANGWALAIALGTRCSLADVPSVESVIETWPRTAHLLDSRIYEGVGATLRVGVVKEMNRLSRVGAITVDSTEPRTPAERLARLSDDAKMGAAEIVAAMAVGENHADALKRKLYRWKDKNPDRVLTVSNKTTREEGILFRIGDVRSEIAKFLEHRAS